MKKTLLLFALSLSLTSCKAQKVEPTPKIVIPLTVNTIAGDQITMQSETGHLLLAFKNPNAFTLPEGLKMEEGRKYFVSYRYLDCKDCFKRKIEIVAFSVHPEQAAKDCAKIKKDYQ